MFEAKPLPGLPGITLLRTTATLAGKPLMWAHFVGVDDCFIDSGNARCDRRALAAFLDTGQSRGGVLLHTHLHEDHCGNDDLVTERTGARVLVPGPLMRRDYAEIGLLYRVFWGRPVPPGAQECVDGAVTTCSGRSIHPIPAPGHTPCHTIYRVLPDDLLVTGDAVPLPRRKLSTMPVEDYLLILATLRRIRALLQPGTRVITAHAGLLTDPADYIDQRLASMQQVAEAVQAALLQGRTPAQVTREVCGRERWIDWLMAPRISRRRTVESIREGLARGLSPG